MTHTPVWHTVALQGLQLATGAQSAVVLQAKGLEVFEVQALTLHSMLASSLSRSVPLMARAPGMAKLQLRAQHASKFGSPGHLPQALASSGAGTQVPLPAHSVQPLQLETQACPATDHVWHCRLLHTGTQVSLVALQANPVKLVLQLSRQVPLRHSWQVAQVGLQLHKATGPAVPEHA